MPPTIRPITDDELTDWFAASGTAFYIWASDPHAMAEFRRPTIEIDRAIGAFEDGTIVGTFRSFGTRLTVPGGARIPVNAVSAVTVRPTHRRQGILTRMIGDDTRRAAARGDAASILIAAEWPIYGRFGYGPATWQAKWTLRTRAATVTTGAVGRVEVVDRLAARQVIPAIYDAYAAAQPGEIERIDRRWDGDLGIEDAPGRPRWSGQVAIHRDDAGTPDGYVRFHGEEHWDDMVPDHRLIIDELHGATLAAEIDLWRHLAQMDLTASIEGEVRREHEPIKWHLSDPRAARVTGVADFLWVRVLERACIRARRCPRPRRHRPGGGRRGSGGRPLPARGHGRHRHLRADEGVARSHHRRPAPERRDPGWNAAQGCDARRRGRRASSERARRGRPLVPDDRRAVVHDLVLNA
jgi:predicted N-acetyltransferase YhbS